jgi:hypothetical protein
MAAARNASAGYGAIPKAEVNRDEREHAGQQILRAVIHPTRMDAAPREARTHPARTGFPAPGEALGERRRERHRDREERGIHEVPDEYP